MLEATGRKVLGEASASGGASLEVGGAHWFAEAHEKEEATVDQEEIDGSIVVTVRLSGALTTKLLVVAEM